jgi:hypothetical protein
MRKKLIWLASIVFAISLATAADLYLTVKLSDAHKAAVQAIDVSKSINESIGSLRYFVLIGAKDNLRPNSTSCATRSYFLLGSKGAKFISVNLQKLDYHRGQWFVVEIVEGYFTNHRFACS